MEVPRSDRAQLQRRLRSVRTSGGLAPTQFRESHLRAEVEPRAVRDRSRRGPLGRRGPRRGGALGGRFEIAEDTHLEPESLPQLADPIRGRRPVPSSVRGIPPKAEVAQVRAVRVRRGRPGQLHRSQRRDQVAEERVRGRGRGSVRAGCAECGHRREASAQGSRRAVRARREPVPPLCSPSVARERSPFGRARA